MEESYQTIFYYAFITYDLEVMNDKIRLWVTKKDKNELFTEDEILKEFKRKIRRLYNVVTDSFTMNIEVEALTMLTTGEFSRLLRSTQCVQKMWRFLINTFS